MATRTDTLSIRLETLGDGRVRATLGNVSQDLAKLDKSAGAASKGVGSLGQALGALGVGAAIRGLVGTIAETERLRAVLRTMEGSAEAASRRFDQLAAIAAKTPLQVSQVTEAYIKLKNFGFDPLDGTMQALIDQTAALGGGFDLLNGIVLAFGQANAKGKLQAEELLQLAERSVPVYATLGKAMGKTTAEIQDMASKGKLGKDAIALLIAELGKNNLGASAEQAKTLGGSFSTLVDNVKALAVVIGDAGLTQVLTTLIQEISAGVEVLSSLGSQANKSSDELGAIEKAIKSLATVLFGVTASAQGAAVAVAYLIDILGASASAAKAAGSALLGYADAAQRLQRLDLSGAAAGFEATAVASSAALAELQARLTTAKDSLTSGFGDIAAGLADKMAQLWLSAGLAGDGLEHAGKKAEKGASGVNALGAATKKTKDEVTRFIEKLREEVAAFGLSNEQLLKQEALQQKSRASTSAQRDEIDKLVAARLKQLQAESLIAQKQEQSQRLIDEAVRSQESLNDQLESQARTLAGPVQEAYLNYLDNLKIAAEAEQRLLDLGPASAEQIAQIAKARSNASEIYARDLAKAEEAARDAALAEVDAYTKVWLEGTESLAVAIREGLMGGDWGDLGKRLAKDIYAGMLDAFLDQYLVKPMQDALLSGWQGQAQASAPNTVGPLASGYAYPGASGNAGGMSGSTMGRIGGGAIAAYNVYDNYRNGPGGASGALSGAASGAVVGTMIMPGIGTVVGAIIGGLLGFFGGAKDPDIRLGATGRTRKPEREFQTVFGNMQIGTRGDVDQDQFIELVQQFDQSIADLVMAVGGGADEMEAIRARLSTWSIDQRGSAIDSEEILSSRFNAIVEAIEPAWSRFLAQIDDVKERVEAFQALYNIRDQIVSLDELIATLDNDPLEQFRRGLRQLADDVTTTAEALATALEAQDAVAVRDAANAAHEAVMRRLQAEIQLARELEAALEQAQAQARASNLQLAQRIQATGGPVGLVAGVARGNFETVRGLVGSAVSPERALGFLGEFIGSVDAWLQASIGDVQQLAAAEQNRIQVALNGIAAQREAINTMLAALSAERDEIMAGATARAQAQQEATRAAIEAERQAQEEARQAQIQGLQEQLALAQQFAQVLEQANAFLRELTFSSSNPLGGFARLDLLSNAIGAAEGRLAGATGAGKASAAEELLELLQQRIGMVQQEGLFQRPSNDYLALYNDTVRRVGEVRGIAQPEADRAIELQEMLNGLQEQTTQAVRDLGDLSIRLTTDEQARIDTIAAEEARMQLELHVLARSEVALQELLVQVQQDAANDIADLQTTAREQYEWARGEGQRLEDLRQAAIAAQLAELTGGRPVDEFIAERTAEAASLLTDIRDDLRAFLAAISGGVPYGEGPNVGARPGPPGRRTIGQGDLTKPDFDLAKPGAFAPVININGGTGDSQQIARAVRDTIIRELPQFATQLKRELGTA